MGSRGRSEQERLRAKLAGKTMRSYVRISTVGDRKRQDEGANQGDRILWSDNAQLAMGRTCSAEWDMEFDEAESKAHADPDVSGYRTKWDRRPGLSAHYEDAKRGEFHVLGLHFADRLGRNVQETVDAIKAFLSLGVMIYVAEDDEFIGPDDRDAQNNLYAQMVAAEKFSIRLGKRVRSAMRRRAESGLHHGGLAPAWLAWNAATKRYEVVERVADIMRLMVDLRLQGLTEFEIARRMNEVGPTQKGFPWRQGNVNRYLTVRYIEKMEGHSHFRVAGEEPIVMRDVWDPILSPEKAAEIKRVLASSGKRSYNDTWLDNKAAGRTRAVAANTRFILTERASCAVCGGRVSGYSAGGAGREDRYACRRSVRMKVPHPGVQTYFMRHAVEEAVLLALSLWLKDPPAPVPVKSAPATANGERQVRLLNEQIDALLDLQLAGTLSKDDHLRKHQALVERRDEVKRRIEEAGRPSAVAVAQEIASKPKDRVRLRELVHLLVERVELPVFVEGSVCGRKGDKPRPHVRVVLRYPMPDGAKSLLSPICLDRYKGPRRVIAE